MEYKAPVETYSGRVQELVIGKGNKEIKIGGETILPFHFFEGRMENMPRIAMEINDVKPETWPEWITEPFKDVMSDPVAWANKCLGFGAEIIFMRLTGTDPAGKNTSADEAAAAVKKVVDSVAAPVIVYGCGDEAKDVDVLSRVAQVCAGEKLLLGPLVKENFGPISKAAMDNGHSIVAQTPLDINLEKELNVKLLKTVPPDRIVIDPLSSALGYGMEYSFTIIERTKHIGIMFGDNTMQMPIIADLGAECWKTRQAKDSKKQGVLWESVTAVSLVLAGANVLVLRHPDSCKLMKDIIAGKF
jgi:acetyl-CoA decarbonylase/synthase complex subunit delta